MTDQLLLLKGGITKQHRLLLYLFLFFASVVCVNAQTITVSGKVTDSEGPLPGATVLVEGTSNGTVTNLEGEFSIAVASDAVLKVSYLGYATQEVAVNGRTTIDITLEEDLQQLSEVVVVGYGVRKKSDITGAVATVGEKTIQEVPAASDVSSALQGRISGVQITNTSSRPGGAPQIRIRGNRSLGSDESGVNTPLIVLDGIPYNGSLNDINPNDITSFNVLKDASATAIYGSRGANGVILITTKRGRPGEVNLSYNGYTGVTTSLGQYDLMNAEEYAQFKLDAGADFTPTEIESLRLGRSTDWQDLMIKDGYINNHNLSFSGGTENTQYSVSAGYFNQSTVFPGQAYTRYSVRTSIDQKINDWLSVGINSLNTLSYRDGESVSPMFNILTLSPLYNAYNEDGGINERPAIGSLDPDLVNPLTLYRENSWIEERRRLRTFNTAYLEVQLPVEGLSYKLNVGLDYSQDEYGRFYSAVTPMQNITNGNAAAVRNSDTWSYTVENLLNYDRTFGDHTFNFTGLYSVQEQQYNQSGTNANGLLSDLLQYYNFELAANSVVPEGIYQYNKWGLMSFMGRLNYSYKSRYVATVTVRRDGSSRLAEGNKWFTYPAFALAWNIHNEDFLSGNNIISNLRLRTGLGRTSNQAVNPYASLGSLDRVPYNYGPDGGVLGFIVNSLPNTQLSWEFTNSFNIGTDFGLFANRITGTVDYYMTQTNDVLQSRRLPITSGITGTFQQNIGKTEGKGVEIMLSGEVIEAANTDEFNLGFDFNFTAHQEKIVQLVDTVQQDVQNGWFVGEPVNVLYDYEKIGIWQLGEEEVASDLGTYQPGDIKVRDQDGNGVIDAEDRVILGQLDPKWSFGFTARAGYKGFDLSVVTFGMFGHKIVSALYQMNSSNPINSLEGRRNGPDVDYWTPDNPTNEFPRPGLNNTQHGSTTGYFSGDFVKIRSINVGYNFSESLLNAVGLQSARVYVSANNPFKAFFSEYVEYGGLDPEPSGRGTTNNITPGLGRRLVVSPDTPLTKSFMVGLNLTF